MNYLPYVERDETLPLSGDKKDTARFFIEKCHYAHSVPSGKSYYFCCAGVFYIFAIPANRNISRFLLGSDNGVWELSRMWASDNHKPNALTQGLAIAVAGLRRAQPGIEALVSYADPNVGHEGYVYRAASWAYLGQCEEGRYYRDKAGQVVSRRKFHSGSSGMKKADIEALGYTELKLPGKHRYAKGLTRKARAAIARKIAP